MLRMVYGKSGFTPRGLAVWQCGHTRVLHVAVLLAFGGSTTAAPVAAAGCLKSRGLLASQFSARFELQNRNASAFDDALHHFYSAAQAENKLHGWVAFGRYPAGQLLPRQNIIQVLLTHRENYRQLLNHFFDGVPREDVPFIGSLMLSQIPRRIILERGSILQRRFQRSSPTRRSTTDSRPRCRNGSQITRVISQRRTCLSPTRSGCLALETAAA